MSESTVAAPTGAESSAPAPAVAPEAPQVSSAQPAPSTEPQTFASRREVKASVMESVRERFRAAQNEAAAGKEEGAGGDPGGAPSPAAAEPVIDATGRAHDPASGKFTTPPAAAEAAVGTEPAAATPQPEALATQSAATQPQYRRIPIPESDPLREQGLEYIDAVDERQERAIRAALNRDTYRRDVEAARAEVQEARAEALRYRAWVEAQQAWQQSAVSDGVLQQYEALKEVDPSVAEAFLAGKQLAMDADAQARYEAAAGQAEEQVMLQQAQTFAHTAMEDLGSRLPPEVRNLPQFGDLFALALGNYAQILDRKEQASGQVMQPTVEELSRHLQGALMSDPDVLAILTQKQQALTAQQRDAEARRIAMEHENIRQETERRLRAEAVERERQKMLEYSQQPRNPLGALNGNARPDINSTTPGTAQPPNVPGRQNREFFRQQVRQMARQHAPT